MKLVGATFGGPFSDFTPPRAVTLGLSLSGSTLMVVGPPYSVSRIDVEAQSLITSSNVDLAEGDS